MLPRLAYASADLVEYLMALVYDSNAASVSDRLCWEKPSCCQAAALVLSSFKDWRASLSALVHSRLWFQASARMAKARALAGVNSIVLVRSAMALSSALRA